MRSRPENPSLEAVRRTANVVRYRAGQTAGHYESFFLRANHPGRPLALWIRYTIFNPERAPERAVGELWAIVFDGERGRHVAVKSETPITDCRFGSDGLSIDIGDAELRAGRSRGRAARNGREVRWDLRFEGEEDPILMLAPQLYEAKLPRAKTITPVPYARFCGELHVDGEKIAVRDWIGSQNHNWGSRHTDEYAWGQVVAFDTHPQTFLEVATARLKFGPIWTPYMTLLALRHEGRTLSCNRIAQALRSRGRFRFFSWQFRCRVEDLTIEGSIEAPREAFVGLTYNNPPGGAKHCLNSKLASCELFLRAAGKPPERLYTANRAAFEILTDDRRHGVVVQV